MHRVKVFNISKNYLVTGNGHLADSFLMRLMGLMFKKNLPKDYCLIIMPCNQIHMMNMRITLDVVYLNKDYHVVAIDRKMKPWTVGNKVNDAFIVLEFVEGYLCNQLKQGDCLSIENI